MTISKTNNMTISKTNNMTINKTNNMTINKTNNKITNKPNSKYSGASQSRAMVRRCEPDLSTGLTSEQVRHRIEVGAVNTQGQGLTSTIGQIILQNTVTLFNFVIAFLAIIIVLVGHSNNILFVGVAISNTLMGIFQEIRAKRSLDKLSVLSKVHATVIRDGKAISVGTDELVLDDIVAITAGNQVFADAVVVSSDRLEMDESLLTGESKSVIKNEGDAVLSGSYVTSGRAYIRLTAVGEDSYAHTLTAEAKKSSKKTPRLLFVLKRIILSLTVIIFPLGTALFCVNYYLREEDIATSVLGMSASVLGMIPSGLILLTSVTMMVGAMKLAQRKALVQSLPSIETLARVDVLCLDKTGTITDGTLLFERMELFEEVPMEAAERAIAELMGALEDTNSTAMALTEAFGKSGNWKANMTMPFSSDRKWSGASFKDGGSFIIGAPNILFPGYKTNFIERANAMAARGLRVLCLAYSFLPIADGRAPDDMHCLALLYLSDRIRENAAETFAYFAGEDVTIKVISGDNPLTVSAIAAKAGISDAHRTIDMSVIREGANYAAIAKEYTVFGHVNPTQKRELIRGLRENGRTVCMTGDGVNDILAMRESDCSLAMINGSDAARFASDFVMMSEDFGVMVDVLREGRRVINNIEKVAAIFLLKTVYSTLLTLIYIFIPFPYPVTPLQMMPINEMTVGIPAFFIALQATYFKPIKRMVANIIEHTLPAALTVVISTMYLQLTAILFEIPNEELATMVVLLIGSIGFYLLLKLIHPFTSRMKLMMALLITCFLLFLIIFSDFLTLASLFNRNAFFYLPLLYFGYHVHEFLGFVCYKTAGAYRILKNAGWTKAKRKKA